MTDYFTTDRRAEFEEEISEYLGDRVLKHRLLADRLDGISMMGLVYYLEKVPKRYQYTRYDHSIAVAHLTLQQCRYLSIPLMETRLTLLAALCHDMGHGPFSHSSEGYIHWGSGMAKTHQTAAHPSKIKILLADCADSLPEDLKHSFTIELLADTTYWITQGGAPRDWNEPVQQLIKDICKMFNNPLSPDTIDGENRAFFSLSTRPELDFTPCDPEIMIREISKYGLSPVVNDYGKDLVRKFIKLQEKLYSQVIYSINLATSEAMFVRAIELAYGKRKPGFTDLTDEILVKKLLQGTNSARLWDWLIRDELFIPLSKKDPELLSKVSRIFPNIYNIGEDFKTAKAEAEKWLARKLKQDEDFVIIYMLRPLDWNQDNVRFELIKDTGQRIRKWRVSMVASHGMPSYQKRRIEIFIPK